MYTIYDILQDVDANLHGGGVSQLINPYKTFDKARRKVLKEVRPPELIRTNYIEEASYREVDRYAVPQDLKYKDIINIKKLSSYHNLDSMQHPIELVYSRTFSQRRPGARNTINITYNNGIKYLFIKDLQGLVRDQNSAKKLIHDCNSLDENGTWNVGGNIVDLKKDELFFVEDTASLEFDINGSSTTGFIENFTLEEFDLSDFLQKGAVFSWFNFSLPNNIISVKLTLGSNTTDLTTDLFTSTVNQPHDNNQFVSGWNLLKYMLNNLTTVGTPNPSALRYVRFDITTTGQAVPGCRMDFIVARKGVVFETTYNSTYILRDSQNGAWKKIPTSNSDIIVAEEDTYDILMLEMTREAMFEIYAATATAQGDVGDITNQIRDAYRKYRREHKSEAILPEEDLYIFGNQYDGYTGDPINTYDFNGETF